ncbi:MAG: NUDIX hydrolase [Bacteroidota bacterium]
MLTSKIIFTNPWWTYKLDSFQIPDGVRGEYHYVHTEGSSLIIPVMDDGNIILVNQYRYLRDKESVEFPCGGVKPGRTYDEMARLELEEETGYIAHSWKMAGEFNPFNGATDEMCKVFIARDLKFVRAKPEATEEFELLRVPPQMLDVMIADAKIWDGMTLAAWMLVRDQVVNGQSSPNNR